MSAHNDFAYLADPRDRAVLGHTPALMQPLFGGPLPPPDLGTHRFLCGRDGMYIEARSPVLEVRLRVATSSLPLPYGPVKEGIRLLHGPTPVALLREAEAMASEASPREWAGLILWDSIQGKYRLHVPATRSASNSHIAYDTALPEGCALVMDLHSHGEDAPYFSGQDDRSDQGGFYIAGVFGDIRSLEKSFGLVASVSRLVVNGHFLDCPALEAFFG